jgi:hypothetical protein
MRVDRNPNQSDFFWGFRIFIIKGKKILLNPRCTIWGSLVYMQEGEPRAITNPGVTGEALTRTEI